MRRFALILALLGSPLAAGDWVPLTGAEIQTALTDRKLDYPGASSQTTQEFMASGRTLYVFGGRPSWGYWRVEGDQYCSQWPPNDLWACYGMDRKGDALRFVGNGDDITEATYAD